jgi:hypothetical protein
VTRWAASQLNLPKKCVVNVAGAGQSRAFYRFGTAGRASKVAADILNRDEMIIVILWRAYF